MAASAVAFDKAHVAQVRLAEGLAARVRRRLCAIMLHSAEADGHRDIPKRLGKGGRTRLGTAGLAKASQHAARPIGKSARWHPKRRRRQAAPLPQDALAARRRVAGRDVHQMLADAGAEASVGRWIADLKLKP